MRKISSIDNKGRILFVDDKGTGTTVGTKKDCEQYGYIFSNGQCRLPQNKIQNNTEINCIKGKGMFVKGVNNTTLGHTNTIKGSNAISIGSNNVTEIQGENIVALGNNTYIQNYGELSFSNSVNTNRSKFSIINYEGTTTNNTATELFIGGFNNARFTINEDYESVFYIELRAVCLDSTNNEAALRSRLLLYKYVNSTLTELLDSDYLNTGDSALTAVNITVAPVAGTPDYIEVKATGITGKTINYSLTLMINEVRNG